MLNGERPGYPPGRFAWVAITGSRRSPVQDPRAAADAGCARRPAADSDPQHRRRRAGRPPCPDNVVRQTAIWARSCAAARAEPVAARLSWAPGEPGRQLQAAQPQAAALVGTGSGSRPGPARRPRPRCQGFPRDGSFLEVRQHRPVGALHARAGVDALRLPLQKASRGRRRLGAGGHNDLRRPQRPFSAATHQLGSQTGV